MSESKPRQRLIRGCRLLGWCGLLLFTGCDGANEADAVDAITKDPLQLRPTKQVGTPAEALPAEQRVALVLGLQEELKAHGYNPGSIDGLLWPETTAAIRAYQRDAKLVADGRATKELLDHLKFARPQIYNRD